jgi:hypothetical protein
MRIGALRLAGSAAMALLVAFALTASASAAEPPRIFISLDNGHAVVLKVEGAQVSVLALATEVHCVVPAEDAEGPALQEIEGFRAPRPLRPSRDGLAAEESRSSLFDSGSVAVNHVVVGAKTIVGDLEAHHSGEGEGSCQTSASEVTSADAAVPFEAVEFVPVSDPRARAPYPGEVSFFYARTPTLEAYLWTTSEYAIGIRGRAALPCQGPAPLASRERSSLFDRIGRAGLVDHSRFRTADRFSGLGPSHLRQSTWLSGRLAPDAITGAYGRRESGRNKHGRWSCEVSRTAYEAIRYVPALTAPAS